MESWQCDGDNGHDILGAYTDNELLAKRFKQRIAYNEEWLSSTYNISINDFEINEHENEYAFIKYEDAFAELSVEETDLNE